MLAITPRVSSTDVMTWSRVANEGVNVERATFASRPAIATWFPELSRGISRTNQGKKGQAQQGYLAFGGKKLLLPDKID